MSHRDNLWYLRRWREEPISIRTNVVHWVISSHGREQLNLKASRTSLPIELFTLERLYLSLRSRRWRSSHRVWTIVHWRSSHEFHVRTHRKSIVCNKVRWFSVELTLLVVRHGTRRKGSVAWCKTCQSNASEMKRYFFIIIFILLSIETNRIEPDRIGELTFETIDVSVAHHWISQILFIHETFRLSFHISSKIE